MQNNYLNIIASTEYVAALLLQRLNLYFGKGEDAYTINEPEWIKGEAEFSKILSEINRSTEENIIFFISLVPHVQPNLFENIIQQFLPNGGDFADLGGAKGTNYRGMIPTGETALFILAGNDIEKRLRVQALLQGESILIRDGILFLESVKEGEPIMSGRLLLSQECLNKVLLGKENPPAFSMEFPAKKITTEMNWDDLVLNAYTFNQINDIKNWIEHNAKILEDDVLRRKLKPGYRAMFYGPSGTGKTLTASLLGKQFGKEVYRIDLSQIVSKYIGETEKNLEKIFQKAENKDWILFFDEADALFGKRTNVQNAHDRYANQEVSYLLQRVEDYPGLIILASNFKNNIDDAFMRRLHSIIYFPIPTIAERLTLWKKTIPASLKAEPVIQLKKLSEKFELNGAGILNVVHFAALKSFSRTDDFMRLDDLMEGIKREYRKEEKTIN